MSRRGGTRSIRCAEDGCAKYSHRSYASQREYAEITAEQARSPWRCTRHRDPERVLRLDNTSTSYVLVASRVRTPGFERQMAQYQDQLARRSYFARKPEEFIPGLYWLAEAGGSGSGFAYGPGFNAHADDFAEGTRLVISAQILPPGKPLERAA